MWVAIGIVVVAVLIFVAKTAHDARVPSGKRISDEELRHMPFEEWSKMNIEVMSKTGTDVLKIYLRQYEDLKARIDSKHARTMELLDEQSIQRSLASLDHVKAELKRRNVL